MASAPAAALSLSLDSIAEWGKFPRFCVKTYRWGDKFFNTYDSTYVQGTGYKFNVKTKTETWLDSYTFELPERFRISMVSDLCTSAGVWVTYLAVSAGYDINVSQFVGGSKTSRKRFNFRFNCALFSADLYWITNDIGTRITRFGPNDNEANHIRFTGIDNSIFGVDAYYHLNNKRYSRAAAFNYSKIQKRSAGSFFVGFSYWKQKFNFDFASLPLDMRDQIPDVWGSYNYFQRTNNYALRIGYSYNWVFHRRWLLAVSESPILGIQYGRLNNNPARTTASLYNRFQASIVWNSNHWFAGMIAYAENGLFFNKRNSLLSGILTFEASVGYRFNLW